MPFLPLGLGVTPNSAKDSDWRKQAAWSYAGSEVVAALFGWLEYSLSGLAHYRVEGQEQYAVAGRHHYYLDEGRAHYAVSGKEHYALNEEDP